MYSLMKEEGGMCMQSDASVLIFSLTYNPVHSLVIL